MIDHYSESFLGGAQYLVLSVLSDFDLVSQCRCEDFAHHGALRSTTRHSRHLNKANLLIERQHVESLRHALTDYIGEEVVSCIEESIIFA